MVVEEVLVAVVVEEIADILENALFVFLCYDFVLERRQPTVDRSVRDCILAAKPLSGKNEAVIALTIFASVSIHLVYAHTVLVVPRCAAEAAKKVCEPANPFHSQSLPASPEQALPIRRKQKRICRAQKSAVSGWLCLGGWFFAHSPVLFCQDGNTSELAPYPDLSCRLA